MSDLARSLAVTFTEIGVLAAALPQLLGEDHPQFDIVSGALRDAAEGLFTGVQAAAPESGPFSGEGNLPDDLVVPGAGPFALDGPRRAAHTADKQLRALRALQGLCHELPTAPVRPNLLDDGLELICGLLESLPVTGRHLDDLD